MLSSVAATAAAVEAYASSAARQKAAQGGSVHRSSHLPRAVSSLMDGHAVFVLHYARTKAFRRPTQRPRLGGRQRQCGKPLAEDGTTDGCRRFGRQSSGQGERGASSRGLQPDRLRCSPLIFGRSNFVIYESIESASSRSFAHPRADRIARLRRAGSWGVLFLGDATTRPPYPDSIAVSWRRAMASGGDTAAANRF
uniref:Uncharacterized protein n=1 Tax=Plectus sambesii TaxID=2011161 RepID=A0A914WSD7_9BILA